VREIGPDAMAALMAHPFPGNVRELRNAVERAVALCEGDVVTLADLPPVISRPATGTTTCLHDIMLRHEAQVIFDTLRATQGSRRAAAELLGIPLRTFERKLARARRLLDDER
jgi:DNA-binding NtrC family response regulator